jgi:hypothetical protein
VLGREVGESGRVYVKKLGSRGKTAALYILYHLV